jgi:hypothetical protein
MVIGVAEQLGMTVAGNAAEGSISHFTIAIARGFDLGWPAACCVQHACLPNPLLLHS